MKPICRQEVVPFIYLMIRNNFRSQSGVHRVIWVVSTPTARKRSGRAKRAMYMIFISTLHAIFDSMPTTGPLPLDKPSCDGVVRFAPPAPTCVGGGWIVGFVEEGGRRSADFGVRRSGEFTEGCHTFFGEGFHVVGNHLHFPMGVIPSLEWFGRRQRLA